MTALELFETYPKAAEVVSTYYKNAFINSMTGSEIDEEFKEFAKAQMVDNEYIITFIDSNPRGLFDVFDENGFFIETLFMEQKFHFTIVNDGEVVLAEPQSFDTRIECDKAAIEAAMKLLNDEL